MARSSQSRSYWPSCGSIRLQANSPTRTTWIPACCIRARSLSQRASGHCSGYQAVPRRSAGRVEAGDAAKLLAQRAGAKSMSNAAKQHTARFLLDFDTTILPRGRDLRDSEDWIRVYLTYLRIAIWLARISDHSCPFQESAA